MSTQEVTLCVNIEVHIRQEKLRVRTYDQNIYCILRSGMASPAYLFFFRVSQ